MAVQQINLTPQTIPVKRLFGIPVHAATMTQAVERCQSAIVNKRRLMIAVVNAAKVVNMRSQPTLRDAVMTADMTLADGMSVVWAGRLLRRSLPQRIAGIDLFYQLLALADRERYSVYLLGAEQAVLDEVIRRMKKDFPYARLAGATNGYFKQEQEPDVALAVRNAQPDMLFVAMTPPKKEIFLAKWSQTMNVPVCHGVGGSFDVYAGKVKRAPALWQKLGLEWLYRTLQEPRRLWKRYLVTNLIFLWMVLSEMVHFGRDGALVES
jgi:N-acetylglucosaminyldiphosphoundecaprenol N-acetyl-beta-D-mannosaminyltransferase